MNESQIIEMLWKYGHFRNPAYPDTHAVGQADLSKLTLADRLVQEAVRSYQHLQKPVLDELSTDIHGRRGVADGIVGPATQRLLDMPRCGAPDYAMTPEELGSGRWGQCKLDLYPRDHAVTVSWDLSKCPDFLKPVFEQVWKRVQEAYAEVGIALVRTDGDPKSNLQLKFTVPQQEAGNLRGNWIGLAIVAWGGILCTDTIWGMFDLKFNPPNTVNEWTTLIKHEIGHMMGLEHSSGGVMNPSIVYGLPVSWKGDPSWSTLARWYGGIPVTPPATPGPSPPTTPTPPSSPIVPDFEGTYKGRPVVLVYKAQV